MHLIESDQVLSKTISESPSVSDPGAADWFVLIDGTNVNAIAAAITAHFGGPAAFQGGTQVSAGRLQLDVGPSKERNNRPV